MTTLDRRPQTTGPDSTSHSRLIAWRVQLFANWLERVLDAVASSPWLAISLFTLLYLVPTVYIAAHKLFWDDEFFTLYLSMTPSLHELLRALATGADQHPPVFYLITHSAAALFGTSPTSVRLPAILGFWLGCVSLYAIARKFLAPVWSLVAILLPLTSGAYYYASEARGYGIMLGFSCLATLAWINASHEYKRRLYIPLLAASLALAICGHYYAVLTCAVLACGELVRTVVRRKVDVPIWIALCLSGLPLIVFFPIIHSAHGYSEHFWALPVWSDLLNYYPDLLGHSLDVVIGSLGVSLLARAVLERDTRDEWKEPALSPWVAVVFVLIAALPLPTMVLAKFATHGYTPRYALVAIAGVSILLCFCLARLSRRPTLVAAATIVFSLFVFYMNARDLILRNQSTLKDVQTDVIRLARTGSDPIAIPEITVFHRLSFYAPSKLAHRITYPADPQLAVDYIKEDTVDRGLLDLRPWFPINIEPLQSYVHSHPSFLVYSYVGPWSWLSFELPKLTSDIRLIARKEDRLLMFVEGADPARDSRITPAVAADGVPLSLKFRNSKRSLCEEYMGPSNCPAIHE
jgi:Dolichyl-phosphate-mannose-protein mannosyltransferase